MELSRYLAFLAAVLPVVYGAPTQAATSLHPAILDAMKRDLGLNAAQAQSRVAFEHQAINIIETLRGSTGASFAGAWIAKDGKTVNVGITDKALADQVTAAGATPVIMVNDLTKLQDAKKALDKLNNTPTESLIETADFSGIASWHVDVTSNKVVLSATAGHADQAEALAKQVGLSASEFQINEAKAMPTTFATVIGGDAYIINQSSRCSIGFAVTNGFVSAGHCGTPGSAVTTSQGEAYGTFEASVFPGDSDMSFVSTVGGTALVGEVDGYGGGNIAIRGSSEAPGGSSICRSGSTTGVHCGTVQTPGVTVNYPQGSVAGLTQTDVCAEPGDSGGSWYSGDQAQGVTSGGSGDCTNGGQTFFQPVNEILQTYGLTLVTE